MTPCISARNLNVLIRQTFKMANSLFNESKNNNRGLILVEKIQRIERVFRVYDTFSSVQRAEHIYCYLLDRADPLDFYNDEDFKANFAFNKIGFMHVLVSCTTYYSFVHKRALVKY